MQNNGAKWWKFDFHTHTPQSNDYGKGPDWQTLQERTPKEWLLDYMKAEIDCVAVTDHNSGAWIDVLKNELKIMEEGKIEGFRPLIIFPGVEISVHGGVHLLAIFDPSTSSADIALLLGAVEYQGDIGNTNGTTRKSFAEVVTKIISRNGIAIPAHVDTESGLFKEQEGITLRESLNAEGLLAMQVCFPEREKPQVYKDLKLNLAEVAGSDSHHPHTAGTSFCWVKMEQPDINALRLALHDGDDGVLRYDTYKGNPNDVEGRFYIQNIIISNGAKAGRGKQPLEINFSPWLTTLIGGRGSGKSSIINYLRLGFDNRDSLPESLKSEFDDFAQVFTARGKPGMLTKDTEVRIELKKDGRDIALIWRNDTILEEQRDDLGNWIPKGRNNLINKRFPIRMFSQKQLFEMTKDPLIVLKLIDRQFDKSKWQETQEELEKDWLNSRRIERDLETKLLNKDKIKAELDDICAKMKIFEESDHKEVLANYQSSQKMDVEISNLYGEFTAFKNSVSEAVEKVPKVGLNEYLLANLDTKSIELLKVQFSKWDEIFGKITQLTDEMNQLDTEWKKTLEILPWQQIRNARQQKYEELIDKLKGAGEKDTSVYSDLVERRQEFEAKLRETENSQKTYEQQVEKSKNILKNILDHEKKLRDERQKIIENWNKENNNIQVSLNIMGDIPSAEQSFRNIIRKPGTEYSKDICDRDEDSNIKGGFLFELCSQTTISSRWDFREDYLNRITSASDVDTKGIGKFLVNQIGNIRKNTPEDIDRLLSWVPEDQIILKLINNGKLEDIEVGSAGQRTAAMLSLLLSLDDTPLIIDQPEDDLDNRRISDLVVSGLRQLKTKQQVIIVTHNPNIPVNGGAEQIVQLNFASGAIRVLASGALQKNEVRSAVCDVMEGGQTALNNRYYRISKALNTSTQKKAQ